VRTVLTEKQLQLLKSCYNANPRPDALMKEQGPILQNSVSAGSFLDEFSSSSQKHQI
jgi:hypothetical protein